MKKLTYIILLFLIHYCAQSNDWKIINPGTTNNLRCITKIDSNKLIVGGYFGTILSTNDGGQSWSIDSISSKTHFTSMCFIDSLNGWIGGQKQQNSTELLFYTTDGGKNWTNKEITGINIITSIYFLDKEIGFLTAETGDIYKTTNSGSDWIKIDNISAYPNDIKFYSNKSGLVSCKSGIIYKTTDYGSTWNKINISTTTSLSKISIIDSNNIFVSGYNGSIFQSTDSGDSWSEYNIVNNLTIFSIEFNKGIGLLCGGWNSKGFVYTSRDNGLSWNQEQIPSNFDLFSSAIISLDNLFVVGNNGTILNAKQNSYILADDKFVQELNLRPNPASVYIEINLSNHSLKGVVVDVKIYDVLGIKQPTSPHPLSMLGEGSRIDISSLTPGVYFVRVGDLVRKFVKI